MTPELQEVFEDWYDNLLNKTKDKTVLEILSRSKLPMYVAFIGGATHGVRVSSKLIKERENVRSSQT